VTERPLCQVTSGQVVSGAPWRTARSARGQVHYPGFYWSATTSGHVIYESRLELARLLLADFDPDVPAIAAQPLLLRAQAGGRIRRHVPDFLLSRADRTVRVVNVKPTGRLADPAIAEALAWPGELFEARGWGYEVWSGADPVLLANVRFLVGWPPPSTELTYQAALRPELGPVLSCLGKRAAWPHGMPGGTLAKGDLRSASRPGGSGQAHTATASPDPGGFLLRPDLSSRVRARGLAPGGHDEYPLSLTD
jgi:hypothetical protein